MLDGRAQVLRNWLRYVRDFWLGPATATVFFTCYYLVRNAGAPPLPSLTALEVFLVAALTLVGLAGYLSFCCRSRTERAHRQVARYLQNMRENCAQPLVSDTPWLSPVLLQQIEALRLAYRETMQKAIQEQAPSSMNRTIVEQTGELDSGHSLTSVRKGQWLPGSMVGQLSLDLRWLAARPALQWWLGKQWSDLAGTNFLDLVDPADRDTAAAAMREALEKGEAHNVHVRMSLPQRGTCHVQLDVAARYRADGSPLYLRFHLADITARVRTEEELRQRTEQLALANQRLRTINRELQRLKEAYRDLYHNAPVMYFSLDRCGRIMACNETMIRTLGYAREELVGKPYTMLLDHGAEATADQWFLQPGETHVETRWRRRDGKILDVLIRSTPWLNSDGQFLRTRSVAQDITERHQLISELARQADALESTNRELRRINQELDEFTRAASHDIKAPLRTIEGFAQMLAESLRDRLSEEEQEHLSYILQASRRLAHLVEDLLTLSRAGQTAHTPHPCRLDTLLPAILKDLGQVLDERGAQVRVAGELPPVLADPWRLVQLLSNLISNAVKYNTSEPPVVEISCTGTEGGRGVFAVRDNGIGIDPRFHDAIFKPFVRLHSEGQYEGTGTGLAICRKIVEAHGGRIWLESQPGLGTTFYFTLPLAQPDTEGATLLVNRALASS